MLDNKAILLAKIEATYGVDPVPTVAANAILSTVPEVSLIGKRIERQVVVPYFGKLAPINIGEGIKISFSVEFRGAGETPNTPPRIGALIRACNFTETIDATPGSEFTKYDPNSAENGESVTLYYYKDGFLHKVLGCVGTFKLDMKLNDLGKIDFEFTGIYSGPAFISDVAFPSLPAGLSGASPIFRNASFSIHAYAADIEKLSIDIGNEIKPKKSANGTASGITRYFITGRGVKGDCDPAVVALATFNPWNIWDASTSGALSVTVGSVAGNRCIITMPGIVPDTPKYGSREGALTYGYSFTSHPTISAGNNEVSFKFN